MWMEEGRRQRRDGAEPGTGLVPVQQLLVLFPATRGAAPSPPMEPDQEPTALGCSWPAPWDPPNRPCPPHTRIQHVLSHLRREAARAALTHPGLISIKWKAEITGTSKGNWKDRGKKEKKTNRGGGTGDGGEEREGAAPRRRLSCKLEELLGGVHRRPCQIN